ncbi:MAG: hypothetical protein V4684_15705 [Pseudomonadota bacterium]
MTRVKLPGRLKPVVEGTDTPVDAPMEGREGIVELELMVTPADFTE